MLAVLCHAHIADFDLKELSISVVIAPVFEFSKRLDFKSAAFTLETLHSIYFMRD